MTGLSRPSSMAPERVSSRRTPVAGHECANDERGCLRAKAAFRMRRRREPRFSPLCVVGEKKCGLEQARESYESSGLKHLSDIAHELEAQRCKFGSELSGETSFKNDLSSLGLPTCDRDRNTVDKLKRSFYRHIALPLVDLARRTDSIAAFRALDETQRWSPQQ